VGDTTEDRVEILLEGTNPFLSDASFLHFLSSPHLDPLPFLLYRQFALIRLHSTTMDEKSGYAMEDTFKGHTAHYENAVGRTDSSDGALDGLVRRPARIFTPEEEKKLYRKVRLFSHWSTLTHF
jgi:hypothetical protein